MAKLHSHVLNKAEFKVFRRTPVRARMRKSKAGIALFFIGALLLPKTAYAVTVDVAQFGAKGDGKSDDTKAIQSAIDAAPKGAKLTFIKIRQGVYRISRPLRIGKPLTIQGNPTTTLRQATPHIPIFWVTASHVVFDNLRLIGLQYESWVLEEDAIAASGTFRARKPPLFLQDIKITRCVFENFGDAAIMLKYVDGAAIADNKISRVVNVGVGLLSVRHATVSGNTIQEVTGKGVSGDNAWGIYASRLTNDPGELVSQPRSEFIDISRNAVSDVPTWTGIDTHGGNAISVTGNTVTNTLFGVAVGVSVDHSGAKAYAPTNVTISDNILNSGVADGSRAYGITFTGVSDGNFATGSIQHNIIGGYGQSTSHTVPAINIYATRNLTISGNEVRYPGAVGIYILGPNGVLSITGNTILDPWTNADGTGAAMGIRIDGDDNDVVIEKNRILRGHTNAKFVLTGDTGYGMYFTAGQHNFATIRANVNQGHTAVENRSNAFIVRN